MKIMSLNSYSNSHGSGGAERTMETLLRAFQSKGHDVCVLGTAPELGLRIYEDGDIQQWRAGIRNLYWPRLDRQRMVLIRKAWHLIDIYNIAMRRPLETVLSKVRPDVVFVHNLAGWSAAAIGKIKSHNIPVIQILHDHYNICVNSAMYQKGRNCRRQCASCRIMRTPHRHISQQLDGVVGVSRYILNRHLENGAYTQVAERHVIHNVRDPARLMPVTAPTRNTNHTERIIIFGFIGNLLPAKGIEYLLKIFDDWNEPAAMLLIAGSGPPDYVTMLRNRYDRPHISFLGHIEPAVFFSLIDVSIMPSLWQEPLGMVAAESLAFGIPVITTSRGGSAEIIIDDESGFLVEPDEPGALLSVMQRFVTVPSLAAKMSESARNAAIRFLDVDAWYSKYESVINRIIARRQPQ
jgi:glycosyltransferase involved in cell wall biosynthesis